MLPPHPQLRGAHQASRPGFTLVELLLFTGILAVMAGSIVSFTILSGTIGVSNEVRAEVEGNASLVVQRLTRAIQNADAIVSPPPGEVDDSLLLVEVISEIPFLVRETFFHEYQDFARMIEIEDISPTEERTTISYLTSEDVKVGNMMFLHTGGDTGDTQEGITFAFGVSNKESGIDVVAGQYTQAFHGTATMRAVSCNVGDCGSTEECCSGICAPSGSCTGANDCVSVADCSNPLSCTSSCTEQLQTCQSNVCVTVPLSTDCDVCEFCGDGHTDAYEECDDGGIDTASCDNDCTFALCSDGYINTEAGEECDDGNTDSGDGCDSDCKKETVCETHDLRIAFVFDVSGRQGQSPINASKAAAQKFVQYMYLDQDPGGSRDQAIVISYNTDARVVNSSGVMTDNESELKAAISSLTPSGNVNLSEGIELADFYLNGGDLNINAMIIFAAAPPNRTGDFPAVSCDWTDWATADTCQASTLAAPARTEGIQIYVVSYERPEVADALYKDMASDPDSEHYLYQAKLPDLAKVYEKLSNAAGLCECGNGGIDGIEQCDDANDINSDYCTDECKFAACGDGYVQPLGQDGLPDGGDDEQCDPPAGGTCSGTCQIIFTCGDGIREGDEQCDDGGYCSLDTSKTCTTLTVGADCGGGTCDPLGNDESKPDGCSASCQNEIPQENYCYTNNEPCIISSDCFEPNTSSCAVCVSTQCKATLPCSGTDKVYWSFTDSTGASGIRRANINGTEKETLISTIVGVPSDIALDLVNGRAYWTDGASGEIGWVMLDGNGSQIVLNAGSDPTAIAIDPVGGKMYWSELMAGKINRANLNGTAIEELASFPGDDGQGIALDLTNSKLYFGWCTTGACTIEKRDLNGDNPVTLLTLDPDAAQQELTGVGFTLDVAGGKMYMTFQNAPSGTTKVARANLNGSSLQEFTASVASAPRGIDVDPATGKYYYAVAGEIRRANLDGTVEELAFSLDSANNEVGYGVELGCSPVSTACGNNTVDVGETCDGTDLGLNPNCEANGFGGGTLACSPGCLSYDPSGCWTCGNATCENAKGENSTNCPSDCEEAICNDLIDNDGDGFTDCLDSDCDGLNGCEFGTELSCADVFDNDGDGLTDGADSDCGPSEICNDTVDNDSDTLIDCADLVDCAAEIYCEYPEVSCFDFFDNDGDGPFDSADSDCQELSCDDLFDNDGDGFTDCLDSDCDGLDDCEFGTEVSCSDLFDNDGDGNTDSADSDCAELSCDDLFDNDGDGFTDCLDSDCDGLDGCEFGTEVSCADVFDNDGDGLTDGADSDCAPPPELSCDDLFDNDGDGFTDCLDSDCNGLDGCEFGTEVSCADVFDNDGDGLTDGADSDCVELCNDLIDNDSDGFTDCADTTPCDEEAYCEYPEADCGDSFDNDGDGLIDCADTTDCAAEIFCEYPEANCVDGFDNDGDGLTDGADSDCGS